MQKLIKNSNTSTVNGKCGQKCKLFLEVFFLILNLILLNLNLSLMFMA